MKVWKFYAMWVTRNGQQMWEGPYALRIQAEEAMGRNLHVMATGSGFVVSRSVDE